MLPIVDEIRKEWPALKRAPFAFITIAVLFFSVGLLVANWHYTERLETKDGELHRYRVALGIDEASKGALIELSNQELALKARATVAKLRTLSYSLDEKFRAIKQRQDSGKINPNQAWDEQQAAMRDISQDYDRNLAAEALNVDDEIRKRLDPSAIAHVLRVPALISTDGARVPFAALFRGSGFDTFYIKGLADEIEQMANILPADSAKR